MRSLVVWVVVLMVMGACAGSAQPTAATSPSQVRTSPSPASATSSTPRPDLPLTTVTFSCRLPVLTVGAPATTLTAGFVTFPGATYEADPTGVLINRPEGDMATRTAPVLYGRPETGPPSYDVSMKRWLPAGSGQTSPDGAFYVYSVPGPTSSDPMQLHIVTVSTGADRTLPVGPPPVGAAVGWAVGDFDGTYVYLVGQQIDRHPGGVWRVNVSTGSLDDLSRVPAVLHVHAGNAWVGTVDPADSSPPRPGKGEAFDGLAEVNLASGAQTRWMYRAGESVSLLGLDDQDHVVVSVAPAPDFDPSLGTVLLLNRPLDTGTEVSNGVVSLYQMETDLGRIWFGTDHGLYLWTEGRGLQKVFAFQAGSALQQSMLPVGRCV